MTGTPAAAPLPRRVARPVESAFTTVGMRAAGPVPSRRTSGESTGGDAVPAPRNTWAPSAERFELPSTVTHFWVLEDDVIAFEQAVRSLADTSVRSADAGFTVEARAQLRKAWEDVARAAESGTYVPRARVGAIGVSMACRAALQLIDTWDESRAAQLAYELTGTLLGNVLHQGRTVLVESAGQPPRLGALLQRFVAHLHPLPTERPTAATTQQLRSVLTELVGEHPDEESRAAFARCLADLG